MLKKYKKLWFLLNSREKKYFFLLILFCFTSSCLDLIGVISILPFLTVLAQPSMIKENTILNILYENLNLSTNEFIIFLGLLSFVILLINQIFRFGSRVASTWYTSKMVLDKSLNLFDFYMKRPYKFHLSNSNANLIQKCTSYTEAVISGFILPSLLIGN